MSDSSGSHWKIIALILLPALIGVYLLYEWYDERLYGQLAEKDARIDQSLQRLQEVESARMQSEEAQESLRAEIVALKQGHQSEVVRLGEQIDALSLARSELEQELEALRIAHQDAIAEAQKKTAQVEQEKADLAAAYAELESQYESAKELTLALQLKLERVNAAILASAEEHQAKIVELERHLNERVHLARTTPMDADLLRTAQAVGVLPADTSIGDIEQAMAEQSAATKSQLEALQSEYDAARERLAELEEQLQATQAELARSRAETAAALEATSSPDASPSGRDEAGVDQERLAALTQELETERQVRAQLEQQHQAAIDALDEHLEATQQKLVDAEAGLEQARAASGKAEQDAAQQLDTANARIQSLVASLDEERARSTETQTALQEELAATQSKLAVTEAGLEESRVKAGGAEQDAAKRLEAANDRVRSLEADLEEERTKAQEELAAAQSKLAALEAELEEARARAGGVEQDAARRLEAVNDRIQSLEARLEAERAEAAEQLVQTREEAEEAVASLRALYAGFAELGGAYTERGLLLRLAETELHFPAGEARLPEGELASLDRLADLLADQPRLTVRIEGHTDSLGGDELNLALSQQRADAVKEALIARGVSAERMSTQGIGSGHPIGDNGTAGGRSQNRRVEIYVLE